MAARRHRVGARVPVAAARRPRVWPHSELVRIPETLVVVSIVVVLMSVQLGVAQQPIVAPLDGSRLVGRQNALLFVLFACQLFLFAVFELQLKASALGGSQLVRMRVMQQRVCAPASAGAPNRARLAAAAASRAVCLAVSAEGAGDQVGVVQLSLLLSQAADRLEGSRSWAHHRVLAVMVHEMGARGFGLRSGRRGEAQILPSLLVVPVEAVVFGAVRVESANRLSVYRGRVTFTPVV